jgi:hypothetical protein
MREKRADRTNDAESQSESRSAGGGSTDLGPVRTGDNGESSLNEGFWKRPAVRLIALILLLICIWLVGRVSSVVWSSVAVSPAAQSPATSEASPLQPSNSDSIISKIFGADSRAPAAPDTEKWYWHVIVMTTRLTLAAILSAMLAFRPHKHFEVLRRNPYVAETQILLAVVASALMMIVSDNAARAFGIFAAVSLVRFRTNIRDPKEVTVLLLSLAIGLATGVGRWELAIILSTFVLILLWILEKYEPKHVRRAMELKIRTNSVEATDAVVRKVFDQHNIPFEVREFDREDEEEPIGKIVYYVDLSPSISIDKLSDEVLSKDKHLIDSVEWAQKKSLSYLYR